MTGRGEDVIRVGGAAAAVADGSDENVEGPVADG